MYKPESRPGEAAVAKRVIRECLKQGYTVSVHDGEEWAVKQSDDFDAIFDAVGETDSDTLRLRKGANKPTGELYLIWGNAADGSELLADHTDNEAMNAIYSAVYPE